MCYPNLEAEQARSGHKDAFVAQKLNITSKSYQNKKRYGTFKVSEAEILIKMYQCEFEYLFAREPQTA
ncbi:MAG: hypothetical protein FWE33_04575 [Defluviitaleaceae bacterium]|nr:hypothetical protein [Defluviitaleaceae bacterium]